jgi:four helix bundle protein
MQDYRKLSVWNKAHLLTLDVYKATSTYPKNENYCLTSQTRRASVSIPANIAEGCGRGSGIELGRFLQIASGSAHELEYHVLLAKELGYLKTNDYEKINHQIVEIKRMLSALNNKIKGKHPSK